MLRIFYYNFLKERKPQKASFTKAKGTENQE